MAILANKENDNQQACFKRRSQLEEYKKLEHIKVLCLARR